MLVTLVILTEFVDFVVLFEVAIVAIFPNVATAGIEERVVTLAIRELDVAVVSISHDGLWLKDWFQCECRKKQSNDREDRLCKGQCACKAPPIPRFPFRSLCHRR